MSCECPLVFGYVDYRRYLADYYAHAKKCHYGFSFRVFSKRAEISSSNYLRLVIDGKRNLTSDMADRVAHRPRSAVPSFSFRLPTVRFRTPT